MPLINKDAILEPIDFDKVDLTLLPKASLQSPGIILVGEGLSVTPEGILSKTYYNLEDLKDKPLARTNLEVFSKDETNTALQNLKEYTDQENTALNAATLAAIASLSDSTDAAVLAANNHTDSSISNLKDYTNTEILNLKQYADSEIEALNVSSSNATSALRSEIQNDLAELQSSIEDEFVEVRSEVAASFTASDQNLQQTAAQLLADYETKIAAHSNLTDNPHAVTKAQVGLSEADNTSDIAKPVSTAQQAALDLKLDKTANAVSASKLETARTISLTGGVTGTATSFDGSEDISIDVTSIDASKILTGTIPAERVPILNQDTTGNASTANNAQHAVEADHATTASNADHAENATTADALTASVNIQIGEALKSFDGSGDLGFSNEEILPEAEEGQVLRFDGLTWTPVHIDVMDVQNAVAGVSTAASLVSPAVLKAAIEELAPEQLNIQGNAATASKLQNPIKINGKDFDGSEDFDIITGSSAFIGSVTWFNGNPMRLPDGYVQGNGQIFSREDFPDMWEAIERGQFEAVDDATWLADPSQRAKYSLGDGSTTFRMPDLNGVQPNSLNAPFLRGKGTFAVGTVLGDAIRDIQGYAFDIVGGNDALAQGAHGAFVRNHIGAWEGLVADNLSTRILNFGGYSFKASNVVPTANENRPISAVGMWIIKVRGDTVASPESQPATLMHNEFHGNQIIHGDMIVTGEVRFGEHSKLQVNLPIGFVEWYNGPRTHIRMGTLPSDGQLLNRADYPALWAEIARGAFVAVTEADWWATPNNRGAYSLGDGATTFRMPDLNGVQAGSYKRAFLRGADTNEFVGQMRGDAIRDIEGGFTSPVPANHGNYCTGVFKGSGGASTSTTTDPAIYDFQTTSQASKHQEVSRYGYYFKASDVVPTAEEVRPVNAMGVWVIRVSGGVPNNTTGTAAGIDTNTFNGHQTMNAGASIIGDLLLNGLNLGTAFSGGSTGNDFHFTIPRKEDPSRPWIVQVGTHVQAVQGGEVNTYTLPVTFPTIAPYALVTTGDLRASGGHIIGLVGPYKNHFTWSCTGTAYIRMNYIAVGY